LAKIFSMIVFPNLDSPYILISDFYAGLKFFHNGIAVTIIFAFSKEIYNF